MASGGVGHAVARSPDLEIRFDGNERRICPAIARRPIPWPWPRPPLERKTLDGDALADGTGIGEKLVLDVVTDEHRVHCAGRSRFPIESAFCRLEVADDPHIRGRALQAHILHQLFARCTETPRLATMPISRVSVSCERRNANSSLVNCGLRRSISSTSWDRTASWRCAARGSRRRPCW